MCACMRVCVGVCMRAYAPFPPFPPEELFLLFQTQNETKGSIPVKMEDRVNFDSLRAKVGIVTNYHLPSCSIIFFTF